MVINLPRKVMLLGKGILLVILMSPLRHQMFYTEVFGLLDKGAIREVSLVPGQYVSSYFAVPKLKRSPDKWRPILNLKKFNKFVCHIYFKIEDVKSIRKWFQKGTMCAGLDLKDAFLHVPMDTSVKKFHQFKWKGELYK